MHYLFLFIMVAIVIYPILFVIGSAFTPGKYPDTQSWWPDNASWEHFSYLLSNPSKYPFVSWMLNTLFVALFTIILQVIFTLFSGYAYSRFNFRGKKHALILLLVIQMVPTVAALTASITLYDYFSRLFNPTNSEAVAKYVAYLFLAFAYAGGAIPWNTYLLKGYLDSIPRDLDEAAKIDGAGNFKILWKIIIPLAKPILAIQALWAFMAGFSEFILSGVILQAATSSVTDWTVPMGLRVLLMGGYYGESQETTYNAGSLMIAVPFVLLFMALNKQITSGLVQGGSKG
ncbi:Putative polysaccharid ABC-type transport system, permease component [Spiroplasma clarkii]|nr:Putative polysaccharid ABC-type transport system, permease component [Spiroplasma clarkii]